MIMYKQPHQYHPYVTITELETNMMCTVPLLNPEWTTSHLAGWLGFGDVPWLIHASNSIQYVDCMEPLSGMCDGGVLRLGVFLPSSSGRFISDEPKHVMPPESSLTQGRWLDHTEIGVDLFMSQRRKMHRDAHIHTLNPAGTWHRPLRIFMENMVIPNAKPQKFSVDTGVSMSLVTQMAMSMMPAEARARLDLQLLDHGTPLPPKGPMRDHVSLGPTKVITVMGKILGGMPKRDSTAAGLDDSEEDFDLAVEAQSDYMSSIRGDESPPHLAAKQVIGLRCFGCGAHCVLGGNHMCTSCFSGLATCATTSATVKRLRVKNIKANASAVVRLRVITLLCNCICIVHSFYEAMGRSSGSGFDRSSAATPMQAPFDLVTDLEEAWCYSALLWYHIICFVASTYVF